MGPESYPIRLLVVRHGETDENVQGVIQGQMDTDLNAKGRRQAFWTGIALARERIDEIYSSPLRRARDTAMAIASAHAHLRAPPTPASSGGGVGSGCRFWVDDRLMERGFGALEGHVFDRSKKKPSTTPGIEQETELQERLASVLNDIIAGPPPWHVKEQPNETAGVDCGEGDVWVDEAGETEELGSPGYPAHTRPALGKASASNYAEAIPADLDVLPTLLKRNGKEPPELRRDERSSPRTVLLVGHGASISALLLGVLYGQGYVVRRSESFSRVWNCSISEVLLSSRLTAQGGDAAVTVPRASLQRGHGAGHRQRRKHWIVKPAHLGRPQEGQVASVEIVRWADQGHLEGVSLDLDARGVVNVDETVERAEERMEGSNGVDATGTTKTSKV